MERKRTRNILLRLSDEEWNYLKKNVAISCLNTQSYLRALIMGMEIEPKPPEQAAAIYREMNAIGININQIARTANTRQSVRQSDIDAIKYLLEQLWGKIREL